MKLSVEQRLHSDASSMWPYITNPTMMNQWSLARIELKLPGEGGQPDGVGTFRRVFIKTPGKTQVLKEVIVTAEPPHRLVYRVFDTEPILDHRGEMTLVDDPEGSGCLLTWTVEATYRWPGMEGPARWLLKRQLAASLRTLANISQKPQSPAKNTQLTTNTGTSGYKPPNKATLATLWEAAEATLVAQEELVAELHVEDDPKQWFARVYAFVTQQQLQACRAHQVAHVDWVLRLIPGFHTYYADNLQRWRGKLPGTPEGHWADAFATMEPTQGRHKSNPVASLYSGLLKGIQAHIEEDLPRALAQVYTNHYKNVCDYARFRGDYLRMGGIFGAASAQLLPLLPDLPWIMRVGNDGILGAWKQKRMNQFYNVSRARANAFERGLRLVSFSPTALHFDSNMADSKPA